MTKGTGGNKSDCCNAQVIYKNKKRFIIEAQDGGHWVEGEVPICKKCNRVCIIVYNKIY